VGGKQWDDCCHGFLRVSYTFVCSSPVPQEAAGLADSQHYLTSHKAVDETPFD
jgi:hypothetical protein